MKKQKKEQEEVNKKTHEESEHEIKLKKQGMKKKQNNQLLIAILLMAFFMIMVFLVPFIIKTYFNKFTYINLDFTKQKYGKIIFYNTLVPLIDNNGKIIRDYGIDFRSDPRKLEYIKINISDGELKVLRNVKTYISVSPDVQKCEDNVIASVNLARFLGGFAQLDVKGASSDKNYSKEFNITYVNCETNPDNTVIIIKSGEETRIDKTGKNCYELTYTNCEIVPVTEKFSLKILEQYMQLFERK